MLEEFLEALETADVYTVASTINGVTHYYIHGTKDWFFVSDDGNIIYYIDTIGEKNFVLYDFWSCIEYMKEQYI